MIRFLLVSVFFFSLGLAHAQDSGPAAGTPPAGETTPEFMANKPCSKDIQTYCANVEPGGGNIAKCMRDNQDKLSTECKMSRDKMKKAFKEVKEACHDDYEKFCSNEKMGRGRVMKCMKEHSAELSAACKTEIEQKKAEHKARKNK